MRMTAVAGQPQPQWAGSAVAAALVIGAALIWSMTGAKILVPRLTAGDFAVPAAADDWTSAPAAEAELRSEIGGLYAGVEGPDDERYNGTDTQIVAVAEGDTLAGLLQRAGATPEDARAAIQAMAEVYDPRLIREGFRFTVQLGMASPPRIRRAAAAGAAPDDGQRLRLTHLGFKPDVDREIIVTRDESGAYSAREQVTKLSAKLYRASGVIDSSLYLSASSAGVPDRVTSQLMFLFSYDVDFQRDVHAGDSFEVFFTRYYDEFGKPVKSGEILFAALTLRGERREVYRFQKEGDDEAQYFDANGKSIKKSLLRTPVDGARVSSGFGMRRHPILGYSKMHRGIDFAAPTGTPILASGDGTVAMAGRNGGYGNYIRLKHTDRFATAYAHLSRFAKGINAGARVRQGQVIGYVGSTGRSTGPHLHYEILIDGEQVNPAGIKLDTAQPLTGNHLTAFSRTKTQMDALMQSTPLNAPAESAEAETLLHELRGSRQ